MKPIKKILVPVDFADCSHRAIEYAIAVVMNSRIVPNAETKEVLL